MNVSVEGSLISSSELEKMEQWAILQAREDYCELLKNTTEEPADGVYCPIIWDGAYCWPHVPSGTVATAFCPNYIHRFNPKALASKQCMPNGTWYWDESNNITWTNYTLCYDSDKEEDFFPHLPVIKLISKVGYSVSLSLLVLAFLILASFKKLRCPRNNLHMQLFFSFIMRAFMSFLKDALFPEGVNLMPNTSIEDVMLGLEADNVGCKAFTSFWHYFIMANYCWILMEGLYLHNLVFLAMFTDSSGILKYIVMGWGLPVFFIIPWVAVKATKENTLCWTVNHNKDYFWILRGPITVSIVVNFFFFLNLTRVLFLKMFSSHTIQSRRYMYRKWFKSTLVLVPLFGVHYAVLLVMNLASVNSETVEIVWLYIDLSFSSFQGSFVALLYCFLNGEVQSELRKLWQRIQTKSDQPLRSHHSLLTQSLTYLSRGRSSIQSLHSTGDRRENCRSQSPSPCPPRGEGKRESGSTTQSHLPSPRVSSHFLVDDAKPTSPVRDVTMEMNHHPPNGVLPQRTHLVTQGEWATERATESSECDSLLYPTIYDSNGGATQKESKL